MNSTSFHGEYGAKIVKRVVKANGSCYHGAFNVKNMTYDYGLFVSHENHSQRNKGN